MGLLITTASIVWFCRRSILYCQQNTALVLKKKQKQKQKKPAQSFPCSNSDDTVRHVHARCRFLEVLQLQHEISLIIASCVIMPFGSFASLVGGTSGSSPENPNVVVHFVDLKKL